MRLSKPLNILASALLCLMACVFYAGFTQAKISLDPGTGWHSADVPGVDQSWVSTSGSDKMLTYVTSRPDGKIDFETASDLDIASGIAGLRRITLEKFGFTNWTMTAFKHQKIASASGVQDRILMSGSYKNQDGVQVYFSEIELYAPHSFRQISHIQETSVEPEANSIFDVLTTLERQLTK